VRCWLVERARASLVSSDTVLQFTQVGWP
jgi:hypothetical protein